jgi:hypothetical protein
VTQQRRGPGLEISVSPKNFEKTIWSVMIGHKASRNKFPEKLSNDTVCSIIKLSA